MHAMHGALEHSYMTTVPLTLVAAIAAASAPLQEGIIQKRSREGIIQKISVNDKCAEQALVQDKMSDWVQGCPPIKKNEILE